MPEEKPADLISEVTKIRDLVRSLQESLIGAFEEIHRLNLEIERIKNPIILAEVSRK